MTTTKKKRKMNAKPGSSRLFVVLGVFLAVVLAPARFFQVFAGEQHSRSKEKPYALIFGTVYGPDDRGIYGVKVKIRPAGEKNAKWELYSDHRGEFAQRVPAGEADYIVWADMKTPKGVSVLEAKVHIQNDEREDVGLHLKE